MPGERKRSVTRYRTPVGGKSMTKQAFKGECDINKIVAKATLTGFVENVNAVPSMYADVTEIPDYQDALNIVNYASRRFQALPAEIRKKFENDPRQLLDFMGDSKNRQEAETLGLLPKPKEVVKSPAPKVDAKSEGGKAPDGGGEAASKK